MPPPAAHDQLAHVRPPAPSCMGSRAPARLLVSRAALEFERGEHARALFCADEALRASPRLVPALRLRAAALTELGRLDEARLAYARALAIDAADPETLYGAAQLYVSRLPGDRFFPLGLQGRGQKVSDFMIKQKVPSAARGRWPLLCSGTTVL